MPTDVPLATPRLRVGVSACLLGERVRWDGDHRRDPAVAAHLGRLVEWVPVCPELELGLGVPREPVHLEGDAAAPRLVAPASGADHTVAMARLAARRAAALGRLGIAGYVLKSGSPSCGLAGVRVFGDRGRPRRAGRGLFASALVRALPAIPVVEEQELHDPARLEHFVVRLVVADRWRRFRAGRPTREALRAFHAAHELVVRAHAAGAWARLGRLLGARGRPLPAVLDAYGATLTAALRTPAARHRHAAVLRRVADELRPALAPAARRRLAGRIAGYRRGRVPLAAVAAALRAHAGRRASPAARAYLAAAAPETTTPAAGGRPHGRRARRRDGKPGAQVPGAM